MSTPTKRKFHDGDDIKSEDTSQIDKKLKVEHDVSTTTTTTPATESALQLKKRLLREKIEKSKQQLENIISIDQIEKKSLSSSLSSSPPIQSPPIQTLEPQTIDQNDISKTTTSTTTTTNEESNLFFDPRIKVSTDKKKKFNSFTFIQPGIYSKKADRLRSQALADEMKKQVELNSLNKKNTESMDTFISIQQVPDIEWWDYDILNESLQKQLSTETNENEKEKKMNEISSILQKSDQKDEIIKLLNTEYWKYIEHPAKIKTMVQSKDTTPPPIRPDFLLTTKEKKKIRKQRRAEVLRERQERVMNGLEAPPENKVKLSNIMRVIGTQAILDPTKALLEVTKKMDERRAEREKQNQERKLTDEQRKEKKRDKLLLDAKQELYCSIYKIVDLSHPLHRSIIGRSSNENLGSGCIVFHPSCNLVVFEGGLKVQKNFKKLLLKRIDWENPPPVKSNTDENGQKLNNNNNNNSDLFPKPPDGTPNSCHLVWMGPILKKNFKNFHYEISPLESQARKYLQEHSVPHFWDMVKNFSPELQ